MTYTHNIEDFYKELQKISIPEYPVDALDVFMDGAKLFPSVFPFMANFVLGNCHVDNIIGGNYYLFPEIGYTSIDSKINREGKLEVIDNHFYGAPVVTYSRKILEGFLRGEEASDFERAIAWNKTCLKSSDERYSLGYGRDSHYISNGDGQTTYIQGYKDWLVELSIQIWEKYKQLQEPKESTNLPEVSSGPKRFMATVLGKIKSIKNKFSKKHPQEKPSIFDGVKSEEDLNKKILEEIDNKINNPPEGASNLFLYVINWCKKVVECQTITNKYKYLYLKQIIQICYSQKSESMMERRFRQFANDVRCHMQIFKKIFSPELVNEDSLENLLQKIRIMLAQGYVDEGINTINYREDKLEESNFITGANLTAKEIQSRMIELNSEYKASLELDNPEEYVRKCADIFQKVLMIHPYNNGNGRTSRILMTVMLAKKGIFMPSVIDTYYDRYPGQEFDVAGNRSVDGDTAAIQDYFLKRVQQFNPGLITQTTVETLRQVAEKVPAEDAMALEHIVCGSSHKQKEERLLEGGGTRDDS